MKAQAYGWLPGARYTNLRDVRDVEFSRTGFLDIDWKNYRFDLHLAAAQKTRPKLTVARDVVDAGKLCSILAEADKLREWCETVIIVPKDPALAGELETQIPACFRLGYSVPTRYGGTEIPPECFERPVHLLGGRPDIQRKLADVMTVASIDCNRFTLDARFGDYFDGERFRPHPQGGYDLCLEASLRNITKLWREAPNNSEEEDE